MLKSYDFAECVNYTPADGTLFAEEKRVAEQFVKDNPCNVKIDCPICGNGNNADFCEIQGVKYSVCGDCRSIYANVSHEIAEKYRQYEPLVKFLSSENFQTVTARTKQTMWNDFLFWLNFRVTRYLGAGKISVYEPEGNFTGLSELIKNAPFCGSYNTAAKCDAALYLDKIHGLTKPLDILSDLWYNIDVNKLLILSTRLGSGFETLTLKGNNPHVFPYKYLLLPSVEGLTLLLDKAGFEILELSTPGALDIDYVAGNAENTDMFTKELLYRAGGAARNEFRRFLQKNGLSSYARIVARKREAE